MIFAHSYLLALVPLLLLGGWWLHRISKATAQRKLAAFGPASRLPNMLRTVNFRAKRLRFILFTVALAVLGLVVARPMWGPLDRDKKQEGAEFFIILDVSKSMLVRDVKPSRLDSVKASLSEWLKTRTGDRIGLILMAGDAFIQAPLTNDYTALREVLAQSGPKSISLGGTNISEAIKVAGKALEASGVKNKAIVIISDGENTEGHAVTDVQNAHTAERITFFTVGVGTAEGGQVPLKELPADFSGPLKEIVRDEYGLVVTSKLDERNLRAIAAAGGGRYFEYMPSGDTWEMLYRQSLSTLAKKSSVFKLEDYLDLFQIPLLLVIALLLIEAGISTRLKNPSRPKSAVTLPEPSPTPTATAMESGKFAPLAIALFFVLSGSSWGAEDDPLLARTDAMIREGKASEAAILLLDATKKRPADLYLMYNYGIAAYASKQYKEAADAFSEVSVTQDKKLRAKAMTQLGNTHYRIGEEVSKSWSKSGVLVAWERAVEYYKTANEDNPTKISRKNLEVASARLEKLLMEVGDSAVTEAGKTTNLSAQIQHLTKAHEHFTKLNELTPENQEAKQKLENVTEQLATKLTEQARALREKSEAVPQEGKNKNSEKEKLNVQASQAYEKARELTPENKPLAEEHDAFKKEVADKMTDTAQELADKAQIPPSAERKVGELKKQQEGLQKALEQTNKALSFDESNERAQSLQEKVLGDLEKTHMDLAKMALEAGEKAEPKSAENAAENFNSAMQNFQKALAINSENQEAQTGAEQAQEKLAKNMAEIGKKELAKVDAPPAPPKKGEPAPPADPVSELREDIGHLEKAAQNFGQAQALAPGQNDAEALQEQANQKLSELRSQLDQAQAQAGQKPAAEGEEGQQPPADPAAEGDQTAQNEAQPIPGMAPTKPMMSFSETRGKSELEGQFKDLQKKKKIRDW